MNSKTLLFLSALVLSSSITNAQEAVRMTNPDGSPITQGQAMQNILGSHVNRSSPYEDVAWPLFTGAASAGLCKDVTYRTGYTPSVIDAKMEEAYIGSTGIIPGANVHYVVPNSPIALAGLQAKDVILSVNGRSLPTSGKGLSKKISEQFNDAVLLAGNNGTLVDLEVMQGSAAKKLSVRPVKSCNLSVSSQPDAGRFNDTPDPSQVMVSPTIMEQAANDVERQIVMAYAMSKNLSGAVAAKKNISRFAKLLDAAIAYAPLVMPVDPSLLGYGNMTRGLPGAAEMVGMAGSVAANSASAMKSSKNDEISLAVLKSAGIGAQQVVDFWEKYMASDSNSMVYKWVNGAAMSPSRLDGIRAVALQENSQKASNP